jgi:hypothetical protein
MCPQSRGSPNFGNFGTPIWESWDKMTFGCWFMARHKVYYQGEGKVVASSKFGLWWVYVCLWFVLTPKTFKVCTNQLVVLFEQVCVSNWCLSFFLVSISELQHTPLPPKCYEPENMLQFLIFSLFSYQTHIWTYEGVCECVTMGNHFVSFSCNHILCKN